MKAEQFEIDLGKKLQALREKKGKTQQEVAFDLGLNSRETIKQWESWDRHIKSADLLKLAKYYNVSVDYLLGLREDKTSIPFVQDLCDATGLSQEAVSHLLLMNLKFEEAYLLVNALLSHDKFIYQMFMLYICKRDLDALYSIIKEKGEITYETKDKAAFSFFKLMQNIEPWMKAITGYDRLMSEGEARVE